MTLPDLQVLPREPEQETALDICHGILDCRNFADITQKTLQRITGYLEAETSVLFEFGFNGKEFRPSRYARHEVPEQALRAYDQFIQDDPVILQSFSPDGHYSLAPGKFDLVCLSEIRDEQNLTRSAFYNDFLRPQHIHHVMALFFRPSVENASIYAFGFHRPRAARCFSDTETRRAMQVAPALFACINGLTLTERLKQQEEILSGLTRATDGLGVMIIDNHHRIRYANPCAAKLVGLDQRGTGMSGLPVANLYTDILKLCTRVRGEHSSGGYLRAKLSADCSAVVQLLDGDSQRILVTLCPPRMDQSFDMRVTALGMTRRENDIIRLVVAGSSNPQIADQLCLSTRTVENHLRSIFSKAAVHSRTQLVRALLTDD